MVEVWITSQRKVGSGGFSSNIYIDPRSFFSNHLYGLLADYKIDITNNWVFSNWVSLDISQKVSMKAIKKMYFWWNFKWHNQKLCSLKWNLSWFFNDHSPDLVMLGKAVKFWVSSFSQNLSAKTTPYNVGSVLWRLFSTLEVVQYIGGITSVLWGIASVLWRLFSTVGR